MHGQAILDPKNALPAAVEPAVARAGTAGLAVRTGLAASTARRRPGAAFQPSVDPFADASPLCHELSSRLGERTVVVQTGGAFGKLGLVGTSFAPTACPT